MPERLIDARSCNESKRNHYSAFSRPGLFSVSPENIPAMIVASLSVSFSEPDKSKIATFFILAWSRIFMSSSVVSHEELAVNSTKLDPFNEMNWRSTSR